MKTTSTKTKYYLALLCAYTLFASTIYADDNEVVKTTVFSDNFNRAAISPGGVPETTYSAKYIGGGASPVAPNITSNVLRLPITLSTIGTTMLTGELSKFKSPFAAKIKEIDADSIVWSVNAQQNATTQFTGFTSNLRGLAVILLADNEDLALANGYALVNGESPYVGRYRLVKFTGGLDNNTKVSLLINGQSLSENRSAMSFRIVYMPATDTWKLYERIDGPASPGGGSFVDPEGGGSFTKAGETVDSEHTSKAMTNFGFLINYPSGTASWILYADNYAVNTYKTESIFHTVNITAPTNGTIEVKNGSETVTDGEKVLEGTSLTLTATPADGYQFEKWWDDNTDATRTFELLADVTISATFSIIYVDEVVKTTVFADNFNRASVSPGGAPEMTYSAKYIGGGASPVAPNITSNVLRLPCTLSTIGTTMLTGELSKFKSPFAAKIKEMNADSVVWTVNAQQNATTQFTGFTSGLRGLAVILLADNEDLALANGYALVNGESPYVGRYRLVKFTGGLDNNTKVSLLINGQSLSENRSAMSFRIVYIPKTDIWKLYERIDGPASPGGGSFVDPEEGGSLTKAGETVDSEHTSKAMTNFGFLINYPSSGTSWMLFADNYAVNTYKTYRTGVQKNLPDKFYSVIVQGQSVKVDAQSAKITLYDMKGAVLNSVMCNGTATLNINGKGIYILKLESGKDGIGVEKIIIN